MAKSGTAEAQSRARRGGERRGAQAADMGIDIVNDGELSKVRGFSEYVRERLGGLGPSASQRKLSVMARDARDFPGLHRCKISGPGQFQRDERRGMRWRRSLTLERPSPQAEIANLKAALKGLAVEAYLPSIAPGTIEHWLTNKYYAKTEEFVYGIAEAMSHEYKLIADAGFLSADRRS